MGRILLLSAALVCGALLAHAQGFRSVHSSDGFQVWAVGNNGLVFRSFDGGATWSQSFRGTSTLRKVFVRPGSVWMVSEDGRTFSSTNGGAEWIESVPVPGTTLHEVLFINERYGWVAGDNGTILRTTNNGLNWSQQTSGTTQSITSLAFRDSSNGYAGGSNGTLLKTIDGGATWTNTAPAGWIKNITSVSVAGSSVFVAGVDGFSARSRDGGVTWTALDFETDSQSDVNAVHAKSENDVVWVGGGGYIRTSQNGGSSFDWPKHGLHSPLNAVFFFDAMKGWACGEKTNVILRTTDGGNTWQMPTGTTMAAQWQQRLSLTATVRGNAFDINPWNKNTIYCALGTRVFASYNRGDSWTQIATLPAGGSKVNSFYISRRDTNTWIAAFGAPDRIVRTTNRGASWTDVITKNFSEYGMPLEMDGSHPDTLYFGPEDGKLYRSIDFGVTWSEISTPGFRSPCDVVVVRGAPDVIWVGDGVTGSGQGQMFVSRDAGRTFQLKYSVTGSEIPTAVGSSLDNKIGYATAWGSGGVMKTVTMGESWSSVATTGSTWGIDIAKDDPNVVMFGVYGGGTSYLSSTAGASFSTSSLSGSNYAIFAYDRATFLAQQSGGIFKYNITYTVPTTNQQALSLTSPTGGENWSFGTSRNITWSSTGVANVKIEYKTSGATPWQTIAASTPAGAGSYAWAIPNAPTSQARVRIMDAASGAPIDSSNPFSITVAGISLSSNTLQFGSVVIGSTARQTITLTNGGTAPLVVTSVSSNNEAFVASRGSFSIPAGSTDTLSIIFAPAVIQPYSGQMQIASNAPGSPVAISVSGTGLTSAALAVLSPNGGEDWTVGSTRNITWSATNVDRIEISYRTAPGDGWRRIVQSADASLGSFAWVVPNTPTTQARVRIVDRTTGGVVDSSDNDFTISGTTSVVEGGIPTKFELQQNYPNPFNPSTRISYGLPSEAFVELRVFNMIGQEIAVLVSERQSAGRYTVSFDAQSAGVSSSSGLYFYRLSAGDYVEIRKMMLVK